MNDNDFTKAHKHCQKQQAISQPKFRAFILDIKSSMDTADNILNAEEDDDEHRNTDGEVEESAEVEGESSDSEEDGELQVVTDKQRESFVKKVAEVEEQAKEARELEIETEREVETEKAKEGEKQKAENQKATKRKSGGIKRQTKKWQDEAKAQNISRLAFLEGMYVKFNTLTSTHKALIETYDALNSKHVNAKADREERDMAKANLVMKEKELAQAQSKNAALEGRLSFTMEEMAKLKAELEKEKEKNAKEKAKRKALRKEQEEEKYQRAMEEFQVLEMHIPTDGRRVSDEVCLYDTDNDSERPCYTFAGKTCLHLNLRRVGNKITVRGFNWGRKRSPVEEVEEPAAQRARFSP